MRKTISLLFILLLTLGGFGQIKKSTEYTFPDKDSEFTVTFPSKPIVEKIFSNGKSGLSAELENSFGFVRAESIKLTATEAETAFKKTDEDLSGFPMKYAEANGLYGSSVKVGADKFGRYAKLRGYKKIDGISATFEVYFYFGKSEIITLYAGAASAKYPTAEITKFFDSFKNK